RLLGSRQPHRCALVERSPPDQATEEVLSGNQAEQIRAMNSAVGTTVFAGRPVVAQHEVAIAGNRISVVSPFPGRGESRRRQVSLLQRTAVDVNLSAADLNAVRR